MARNGCISSFMSKFYFKTEYMYVKSISRKYMSIERWCALHLFGKVRVERGVSEKVSAVGFYLGSGLFGSCNSN